MSDDLFALGSTHQAPGAWPNGTRVAKVNTGKGDSHGDGALATVLGSHKLDIGGTGYCVEWDDAPGAPVWIVAHRLERVPEVRTCRVCGCTDDHACVGLLVGPCYWIEPDLCSSCR